MPTKSTDTETREVRAVAKYVRVSAGKARLVIDLIRRKPVPEALDILRFCERAAAVDVEKVLRSAVANAENNNGMRADDLVIVSAYVDQGPTLKRIRPRAKGSASRILKRMSHITVVVAPRKEA
ncbi:LSU ribosomal protein L22P [Coriobacterium glomerans PW2]|uniref:Large ribosomal subunit protein uL22 n=1 Tax=Coriobacterium glomerans (strain ATCC 49209 / DSM 20642 / JCM 10262 / PW2) TaxID=700015 RepID=F2N8P4_CORGP|nr:50S ribosomal protein L22 [Coriobacterium glomerans]AEB07427.1 LSU ribosomal protein L22P [Coriobacterium glomerans PW2]